MENRAIIILYLRYFKSDYEALEKSRKRAFTVIRSPKIKFRASQKLDVMYFYNRTYYTHCCQDYSKSSWLSDSSSPPPSGDNSGGSSNPPASKNSSTLSRDIGEEGICRGKADAIKPKPPNSESVSIGSTFSNAF